jgi:hypothetical protein
MRSKKVEKQEEQPVIDRRAVGESCPKCHGGRVYYDARPGKRYRGGTYDGIPLEVVCPATNRSCLDCWHKW